MPKKNSVSIRRAVAAVLGTLAVATIARAEVLTYGADVGVGETDNVTLSANNKVSQTMAIADLDFALKQQTRLLDLDARGNFSYLDYLQNAYGGQLLGRFDGLGRIALIPERLTWSVQDDFGQSTLDPYAPTTPNNLEDVNYFSTGPDLALRLGATSFVNMSARYARATYETSPFNSNRLQGSINWGLQMSADSSVSLNADMERVLFQDTVLNADFDRTNVFADYTLQGARTKLSVDLGATRVSQSGDTSNGSFARLLLERALSRAAKLTFSAGRDLTDASASFSGLQAGATGITGTAPAAQTAASYTNTYASAGWQYERNRTLVALTARWNKNTYEGDPALNYTITGAEARLVRKLSHELSAEIGGRIYKYRYPNAALDDAGFSNDFTDATVGGSLSWRHGRGLEVKLRAEHSSRVASGVDAGYRENRVFLTIGYRPRPADIASDGDNENPGAKAPGRIRQP